MKDKIITIILNFISFFVLGIDYKWKLLYKRYRLTKLTRRKLKIENLIQKAIEEKFVLEQYERSRKFYPELSKKSILDVIEYPKILKLPFTKGFYDYVKNGAEKIENISKPITGKLYLVPCIIMQEKQYHSLKEENGRIYTDVITKEIVTPIYNYPHEDKENGQEEIHYHIDTRFTNDRYKYRDKNYRVEKSMVEHIEYRELECLSSEEEYSTNAIHIDTSKLEHKCIHKGKCPHRGFNLSNVKPVDGVITCPLHSLKFNAETKQLIE